MSTIAYSKINWTQAVAFLAMICTLFGVNLPDDVKVQMIAGIQAAQTVITWILHNFSGGAK